MKAYYRVYSEESTAAEHCDTLADAQARAEELAAKHPGRCFEILKCIGHASTSKASTFWMDGEEPPEKPRWRMLEEGEPIADGDEFSRGYVWSPSQCAGQKYTNKMHQPHRRPL